MCGFTPESIRRYLSDEQFRLYRLIWQRFVSSQMTPAVFDQTTVDVAAKAKNTYDFRVSGSVLKFDGFLKFEEEDKKARAAAKDGQGERPSRAVARQERSGEAMRIAGSAGADLRGQAAQAAGAGAGAEVHRAAAALQRGFAGEDPGRAWHRPAFDLRVDHQHHPGPRLREEDRGEVRADRDRNRGDRAAGEELPLHLRRAVHGPPRGRTGRGRRRSGEVDRPAERLLRPLREGADLRRQEHGRHQAHGADDERDSATSAEVR